MLRFKTVVAILVLAPAAAPAAAQAPTAFERDGTRFEYVSRVQGDVVRITGTVVQSGERFDLKVRPNGRVRGEFGNQSVSFFISRQIRDRVAARIRGEAALAVAEVNVP